MKQLLLTKKAIKDLEKLQKRDSQRVLQALKRYASSDHGDLKKLTDVEPPEWRLRVGALRVRFRFDDDRDQIVLLRVLPRDKAY